MKEIAKIVDERLRIIEKHFQKLGDSQAVRFILGQRMSCIDEFAEKAKKPVAAVGKLRGKYNKRNKAKIYNSPTTVPSISLITSKKSRGGRKKEHRFLYGNLAAEKKMGLKSNDFTHIEMIVDDEVDSFNKSVVRKMVTLRPMKDVVVEAGYNTGIYKITFEKVSGGFRIHCGKLIKENKLDTTAYKKLKRNRFPFLTGIWPENCHKFMVK